MRTASGPEREEAPHQRVPRRGMRSARMLAAVMVTLTMAACGDPAPPEPEAPAPQATKPAIREMKWIRVTDGIAPELWLASREAGNDLEPDDPAVGNMARILEVAAFRFRDHMRMIANRAVQLEAMLAEKGIAERAPRLIVILSQVPGPQRSVESFASLTQQYYNLRLTGLGQGPAIDALRRELYRTPGN